MATQLNGTLFKYSARHRTNVAFSAGRLRGSKHIILIGGLTDGLLDPGYSIPLAERLEKEGWCLVQPLLSSAYQGYGVSSLDKDAEEINSLITSLRTDHESKGVVLMGHSTGCQDIVRSLKSLGPQERPLLLGFILQAPVSDREWLATKATTSALLQTAKAMVDAGKGEEILFRDHEGGGGTPVSARRFVGLAERGGDDDMFSSDFSDDELKERLGHCCPVPSLVLISGSDEYMPPHIERQVLGARLVHALGPKSAFTVIEKGVHDLAGSAEALLQNVVPFLQRLV